MRFRIPPFLPPYALLFLVITYAVGSLWLGLGRLDTIRELTEAAARNAETAKTLKDLLAAVNDIESAGRGYALTADQSYLEPFERGRRRVPALLSELRDQMRDDNVELALIEDLVSLIAERTTITVTGIERKRSAPDAPFELAIGRRGKESTDEIRAIVATLVARERDELDQVRQTLNRALDAARGDLYVMSVVPLLLVIALFLAVRRLRSFIRLPLVADTGAKVEIAKDPLQASGDAEVGTLLRDALLRTRLAAASAAHDSGLAERQGSLVSALEAALAAHSAAQRQDPTQPEPRNLVDAMSALGQAYSSPDGLTINMTIDRKISVPDAQKAFLFLRSAEWALEAITLRKRTGKVMLSFTTTGDRISLGVLALTDNPRPTIALSPKEAEEANALRQGALALEGAFVADEGPTGFSLTLTVPAG